MTFRFGRSTGTVVPALKTAVIRTSADVYKEFSCRKWIRDRNGNAIKRPDRRFWQLAANRGVISMACRVCFRPKADIYLSVASDRFTPKLAAQLLGLGKI